MTFSRYSADDVSRGAMLDTPFTRLVGCQVPIQQAGMGGIANVELAAAVANAGGLGMLNMTMAPAEEVAGALEALGQQTTGAFGMNFLMPFLDLGAVEVAASRCRVVEFFYGDPDPALVGRVHEGGGLAAWQVGSSDEALAAEAAGCDLIIAQGIEAGGHVRGHLGLLTVLGEVLDAVSVPVLAAGGIGSAAAMAAALAARAAGVRVGTRFVVATESPAHPVYVDALLGATAADTTVTTAFSVMWPDAPHRVLRASIEAMLAFEGDIVGEMHMGEERIPIPRGAVPTPQRDMVGTIEAMPMYAGESVDGIASRQTAKAIIDELADGAEDLLRSWT